jgi:ribosomal protein S18 acetylase RimI-like enzyme
MAAERLVPSVDLMHRVIGMDLGYTLSRMRVLERIPGNPIGTAVRREDNVTALMARQLPSLAFNRVVGLRRGQAHLIAPLVDWYHAQGTSAPFEIAAGDDEPEIGRELARLGFFQSGFHAALVREPDADMVVPAEVEVQRVANAEAMDEFLAAYLLGWGIPEPARQQFKRNARPWIDEPGWSLYLARCDGQPAATAILYMNDGVGYLADAAADPAYRRRGLHAALLRRRIRDASRAGARFVCSGAFHLSTSHRNMERAGMRLLFLRAIWAPL